jgi:hypothetical protein
MTLKIKVVGEKVVRGKNLIPSKGWRLIAPSGKGFKATLIHSMSLGGEKLAQFRVLPHPRKKK